MTGVIAPPKFVNKKLRMARVVLVSLNSMRWGRTEELGVSYIGAVLRANGHDVELVAVLEDLNSEDLGNLKSALMAAKPTLVGIGCSHSAISLSAYRDITEIVRGNCPSVHLTSGGYWATFNSELLLRRIPEMDSVVVGEGEDTVVEMVRLLASGDSVEGCPGVQTRTNKLALRPTIDNLDSLPAPLRSLKRNASKQVVSISTSRGCLARCTFCNVPMWMRIHGGRQWRGRSPKSVVDEISNLHFEFGVKRFWIVDSSFEDPFPTGAERVEQIADSLIERNLQIAYYAFFRAESICDERLGQLLPKLVSSGLRRAFIGAEAGTDEDLRRFGKRARTSDVSVALRRIRTHSIVERVGFIMFSSHSTPDHLSRNLDFLAKEDLLFSTVDLLGRLELYTGSAEINRLQRDGLLNGDPGEDSFCYEFVDARVGIAATNLTSIRDEPSAQRRWEALHTAHLVVNGAGLDERAMSEPNVFQLRESLDGATREMREILTETNKQFFSKVIDMTVSKWSQRHFLQLVDTYIDGYHAEISATCDALVTEFLLEAKSRGVDVVY